jgi:hypothetical protein
MENKPNSILKKVILTERVVEIIEGKAQKLVAATGQNGERAFSMALRTIVLEWDSTQPYPRK